MSDKKDLIVSMKRRSPGMSVREIGKTVGVSGAYVHQVLKENGIDTSRQVKKRVCQNCGTVLPGTASYNRRYCRHECRKEAAVKLAKQKKSRWSKHLSYSLTCQVCKKKFSRRRRNVMISKAKGCKRHICTECFAEGKRPAHPKRKKATFT